MGLSRDLASNIYFQVKLLLLSECVVRSKLFHFWMVGLSKFLCIHSGKKCLELIANYFWSRFAEEAKFWSTQSLIDQSFSKSFHNFLHPQVFLSFDSQCCYLVSDTKSQRFTENMRKSCTVFWPQCWLSHG